MKLVTEAVLEALLDSLKLLPFLFLTYLLMEFLEHKAGDRLNAKVTAAGRVGPLWGAALGLLPQCGFSTATAEFYVGGLVSTGTLLAVFLATSDEMLPVFLGEGLPVRVIAVVLGIKFLIALLCGFVTDLLLRRPKERSVSELCQKERCHCERGIFVSAAYHTARTLVFVLLINVMLGVALAFVGTERLSAFLLRVPFLAPVLSALLGLVPNCAVSVAIATLYARGVLSFGALLAGLLPGAGAGLLVLFRASRREKRFLWFLPALFLIGVAFGFLFDFTGLSGLLGI